MKNEFIYAGYSFLTKEEGDIAIAEQKKVDYLRKNLNHGNPDTVHALYEKAIAERFFKTPIGMSFLKELQDYLIDTADYPESEISAIPVPQGIETSTFAHTRTKPKIAAPQQKTKEKEGLPLHFLSYMLNVILIIAVIAMFIITLKADQPNILNYENSLINKYADWEQELTQREAAVREKELELSIHAQ